MNNLSWFLYAVDTITNVGIVLKIAAICLGAPVIISGIGTFSYDHVASKVFPIMLKIFIPILILAVLMPSERTIYFILGSEIGEEVTQSETAKKVHDAVNKKLDEYLGEGE